MKHRKVLEFWTTYSLLAASALFLLLAMLPATAAAYESIRNFTSDITVHNDGTFDVVETIVYDFDKGERHGIFRYIPLTHSQPASSWYKDRSIIVDITSVMRDGAAEPYVLEGDANEFRIRIGDENVLHTGVQEYEVSYTVSGGYSYYENQSPEIYWNVTGHNWPAPILSAQVVVHDPEGIMVNQKACYRGYEGEATSCQSVATTSMTTFTTGRLNPGEGFTIAQGLESNVAVVYHESIKSLIAVILFSVSLTVLVGYFLYRFKTRYKPDTSIVAQYEPYPEALPMYTGVLMDGRLDARDISAGFLYLAQQGFIKIRHLEEKVLYFFEVDDYEVELLKNYEEAPTHFHVELLKLLFWSDAPGQKMRLSSLKSSQSKQMVNRKILSALRTAVAEDVVDRGFYEQILRTWQLVMLLGVFVFGGMTVGAPILLFVAEVLGVTPGAGFFAVTVLVLFVPLVVVVTIYRRRTREGYIALNHLKGFKDFLRVTDKDRMKFHNAPQKSPEQFMEFLPYAVALGVEKQWAEVFKDITIANPDWYEPGASETAFSATALIRNLGGFAIAVTGSAGSSSSGSSGGGFSGGGSGGGGGGSW